MLQVLKSILLITLLAICAFLAFGAVTSLPEPLKQKSRNLPVYISDIAIVDVLSGQIKQSQNVLIVEGTIADISSDPIVIPSREFIEVKGKGKYLMPSLWDMHIHSVQHSDLLHYPLYIARGILNVRDLGNTCSWAGGHNCSVPNGRWQRQIEDKVLLGPKSWSQVSFHMEELESQDITTRLNWLHSIDDTVLKLQLGHDTTSQEFESVLQQAKKSRLPVVGHLPANLNLMELDLSNLQSIEHDRALYTYCSESQGVFAERIANMVSFASSYDESKCREVMDLLKRQRVAYTPTHIASSMQDFNMYEQIYERSEYNQYIDTTTMALWRMYAWLTEKGLDEKDKSDLELLANTSLVLSKLAQDNGVLLLAGTDALDAFVYPGFSLYDELELLSRAGLSNIEVIRAATVNPAKYFQVEEILGSVTKGKRADLLLLDNNPLTDLSAIKNIDSLVFNGEWYSWEELDEMQAYVAVTAGDISVTAKRFWGLFFD